MDADTAQMHTSTVSAGELYVHLMCLLNILHVQSQLFILPGERVEYIQWEFIPTSCFHCTLHDDM